jgi:hypothetical protein
MVEGHVPKGVEVQVLSSAQMTQGKIPCAGIFVLEGWFGLQQSPACLRSGELQVFHAVSFFVGHVRIIFQNPCDDFTNVQGIEHADLKSGLRRL